MRGLIYLTISDHSDPGGKTRGPGLKDLAYATFVLNGDIKTLRTTPDMGIIRTCIPNLKVVDRLSGFAGNRKKKHGAGPKIVRLGYTE